MRWFSALLWGALLGFVMPLAFGGREGIWASSWAGQGTISPFHQSPGLLFSIPLACGAAIAFRWFFSWHRG